MQDLDSAARWYRDVLGLEEIVRWDPEPVMIGAGGTKIALFRTGSGAAVRPLPEGAGWHRVAFLTDHAAFDSAQDHLRAHGVTFCGPIDHGKAHSIYFQDPDGNLLEITHYV